MNIYKLNCILILFTFSLSIRAGIDPNDDNYSYVMKLKKKFKVKDSSFFHSGKIYTDNDTISCKIYLKNNTINDDNFLLVFAKDENDSIKMYTAYDIIGYEVDNHRFISYGSANSLFFIKEDIIGKVELYERNKIPSDPYFIYYFKHSAQDVFYVIAPFSKNYPSEGRFDSHIFNSQDKRIRWKSNVINDKFKVVSLNFFKDCNKLVNKIKNDFYSVFDLYKIVQEYNTCY